MTASRWVLVSLGAGAAVLVALLLDPWVWNHVAYGSVYEHDWGRFLRVMGSLLLWALLALAFWLEGRRSGGPAAVRPWILLAAPAVAGGMGELLKILVRRERPSLHAGAYFYRGFAERPFDTHDLAFPSSHVVVAFAGATALARLYPRAGTLAYLLAAGCAVTRLLAKAHFLSDVVAGGLAGWAVATWLVRRVRLTALPA